MTPEQHNDPIQDARRMLEKDEFGLYIHRPDYAQVRANILMHQALYDELVERARFRAERDALQATHACCGTAVLVLFLSIVKFIICN